MSRSRHRRSVSAGLFRQVGLATVLLGFASQAHAWYYNTCDGSRLHWNAERTTMAISTTSFPIGSVWDAQLQDAMWQWNHANSRFSFFVGRDSDATYNFSNGVNEVVLGNVDGPGSTLAVTHTRSHCTWDIFNGWQFGIDETDIVFDAAETWALAPQTYTGLVLGALGNPPFVFQSVAVHELGHVLGLEHEDRVLATMNSVYPGGGALGHSTDWDPLPDDRQGVRALYGGSGAATDLAASAFKHFTTGSPATGLVSSPESAAVGSTVAMEFTLANMGTTQQSPYIGYYLSDNDVISTSDILLGKDSWFANPGSLGTYIRTLTIPASTPPGVYYLGFMLDPDDVIAESKEYNSNQEMPRTITIYVAPPFIAPVLTGTIGTNGWYTSNVSLTWRIDSAVPLSSQTGCSARTTTSDTTGVTYTCIAINSGGTTSQSVTILRDATPPVVTITTPKRKAQYKRNAAIIAAYGCTDATAGISLTQGCVGTVANGTAIDTATAGTKIFTVTGRDRAGNAATASVAYTVK